MNDVSRSKLAMLVSGDVLLMYISLVLMLIVRYGGEFYFQFINYHILPFSILFVLWMLIFYVGGFYDLKNLKNNLAFKKRYSLIMIINFLFGIIFFYTVPVFGISPKTNLVVFFIIFGLLCYAWRHIYNIVLITTLTPLAVTIIGSSRDVDMLVNYIKSNPQIGYRIKHRLESIDKKLMDNLTGTDLLVIPDYIKKDKVLIKIIYSTIFKGIDVKDISTFYEETFSKIPLSELEEAWLIENLASQHTLFDSVRRPMEFILAILVILVLLPVIAIIIILIKIASKGPIIYKQDRIGNYEKKFVLYKFRTMIPDAEADGPKWAENEDIRITSVGKFLRRTHLDELPQLINVIKGDLSFVGPRPERPEFVEQLKKKVPYYEIRHIVKPGITGWAQINYRYAASINDTYEKLQYDIYYLKKRSAVFDLLIILKTIKTLFINPG